MEIKSIKSERDYRRALKQIDKLMEARPATADGDALDMLATLVEAWEQKHHPINAPDAIEAIASTCSNAPRPAIVWIALLKQRL